MDDLDELFGSLSAVLAGLAARKLLAGLYERRRDGSPPEDPSDEGTQWREALVWAALSGMVVGVSRMVGRRASSGALGRARG